MQGIRATQEVTDTKVSQAVTSMQGIRATQDVTDTKVSQAVLVCKVTSQRFLKRCYLYPYLTVVTCARVVFVVHTLTFHSYDSCSSQRNFLRNKIEESEKAGSLGIEPRTPDLCSQHSATELQQQDNYQPPEGGERRRA